MMDVITRMTWAQRAGGSWISRPCRTELTAAIAVPARTAVGPAPRRCRARKQPRIATRTPVRRRRTATSPSVGTRSPCRRAAPGFPQRRAQLRLDRRQLALDDLQQAGLGEELRGCGVLLLTIDDGR